MPVTMGSAVSPGSPKNSIKGPHALAIHPMTGVCSSSLTTAKTGMMTFSSSAAVFSPLENPLFQVSAVINCCFQIPCKG